MEGILAKKRVVSSKKITTSARMGLGEKLGIISITALALFPILPWIWHQPVNTRFTDISAALTAVGQISGLVGMAVMSIAVILSARTVFLDRIFGGLNNLYKIHRNLGIISFLLLLIHPLVLAASYAFFSGTSAALFLLPGSDWPRNFGIMALVLMMLLVCVTFFAKFKYEFLKIFHQLFGGVFVLSAVHTILVESDTSRDPFLRFYMLALLALALSVFSYRTILGRFLVKRHDYIVKEVKMAPAKSVEIIMTPERDQMKYSAGQFVFVSFYGKGVNPESHPFSISSSPNDRELRILVKALGDYTLQIAKLPLGIKAKIEGPFGKLTYAQKSKNQIWIGGGSGIAPFLGMARDLKFAQDSYNVDLYYCAASKSELVFLEELSAINPPIGEFNFIPFCQDKNGFLTIDKILKLSDGVDGKDIFLCGPPPMVKGLKSQLLGLPIPGSRIHSEEFQLL